ncbi:MAG: adventurous gliding motility lipoprotein CglB [Myxococcaceae bacterium]
MRHALVVGLLLAACQTYDFQRVTPFTVSQTDQRVVFASKQLKPNVMLLVDNSGSMLLPTNPADPRCQPGCGSSQSNKCSAQCPTRISELQSAMNSFLTNQPTVARFGLTVFPQPDQAITVASQCRASVVVNQSIPAPTLNDEGTDATLASAAAAVKANIAGLQPTGGTPTAAALTFVGTTPSLNDLDDGRLDLVLLLTDGLPNCSEHNPNALTDCSPNCSQARVDACACTLGGSGCAGSATAYGCLDSDGSVAAVKALLQKGIRTAVVGFGADVASGAGPMVLKAMADEGAFARKCPNGTTAECGGGACNTSTGRCEQSFYSASTGAELEAAMRAIIKINDNPCLWTLDEKPADPRMLAVLVDDKDVQRSDDTWTYDAGPGEVTFHGDICHRLEQSTPQEPVKLEFRIVNVL